MGMADFEEDVAGIETFVHLHDRNACFAISLQGLRHESAKRPGGAEEERRGC